MPSFFLTGKISLYVVAICLFSLFSFIVVNFGWEEFGAFPWGLGTFENDYRNSDSSEHDCL